MLLSAAGEGAEKCEAGGGCIGSAPLEVNAEESGGGAGYVEAESLEGGADAWQVPAKKARAVCAGTEASHSIFTSIRSSRCRSRRMMRSAVSGVSVTPSEGVITVASSEMVVYCSRRAVSSKSYGGQAQQLP